MTPDPHRRAILAHIADSHGGFKLGLMNPETELYDEKPDGNRKLYRPRMTESQEYLWENYEKDMQRTIEIADGDDLIVLHNGDATHGKKHLDQLVSTRLSDQVIIARDNLKPWYRYRKLKAMRVVAGTPAHNEKEASLEILTAEQLAAMFQGVDTGVLYHGLMNVSGAVVDYTHHGPGPGSRNWLRGNVARFYLRDLMQREIMRGQKPPDLVLRAHFHVPVFEYLETQGWASRLYISPAECMLSEFAVKVSQSPEEVTTGFVAWEIIGGEIAQDFRFYHSVDVRTKESL